MRVEENKQVLQRYIDEVQNGRDFTKLEEILHEGFYGDNKLGGISGKEAAKQFGDWITSVFPDIRNEPKEIIAEGDKVVLYSTISGTHSGADFMGQAATGKKFQIDSIAIYTFKEGKLFSGKVVQDMLSEYQQLGFYPPLPEKE